MSLPRSCDHHLLQCPPQPIGFTARSPKIVQTAFRCSLILLRADSKAPTPFVTDFSSETRGVQDAC